MISGALEKALAGQGEYHVEFRAIREDGTIGWVFANGRVVFDNGRAVRMLGAASARTEQYSTYVAPTSTETMQRP